MTRQDQDRCVCVCVCALLFDIDLSLNDFLYLYIIQYCVPISIISAIKLGTYDKPLL